MPQSVSPVHEAVSHLLGSLKQCSRTKDLEKGKALHRDAVAASLDVDKYVASALITMYSKCGSMPQAQEVFSRLTRRDVVLWTSLILGYAENGHHMVSLKLFKDMDCKPDSFTYVAALKACGGLAGEANPDKQLALHIGIDIHNQVKARGFDSLVIISNTLVDMYCKCNCVDRAREVFENMTRRDAVSWNCLMLGYVENGESFKAWSLFTSMDCMPTAVTYVAALKICSVLATEHESEKNVSLEKGIAIQKEARNRGLEQDMLVATTLLDMYCKCGCMPRARDVFDRMTSRDVVAWNSIILGYVGNSDCTLALSLFTSMDCEPDSFTYVAALKACGELAREKDSEKHLYLNKGIELHRQIQNRRLDSHNIVKNSLIDMYSRCGSIDHARKVFDSMVEPDLVAWNSLISGYVANGQSNLAMDLFSSMENCKPCVVTFIAALKACGTLVAASAGKRIHSQVCRLGLEQDGVLATTLMDFYSKCGCMNTARALFNGMHTADTVSWTTLISGYSAVGNSRRVLELAKGIHDARVEIDAVVLTCVLTACSHEGLVEKGKAYLDSMPAYGVRPTVEHYNCMVDLLGRANRLEEALALIKGMPFTADAVTWMTLLGACNKWKNMEVGKAAFDALVAGGTEKSAAYVLMSDIYGSLSKSNG